MQKWTAFLLSMALLVAFVVGLFVQPLDSQANANLAWEASFYNNAALDGDPIVTRADRELVFNWSEGAPAAELPADYFSARWVGHFDFTAGEWKFAAGADDGIRLWVDNHLVVDQWSPSGTFVLYTKVIHLERGKHEIKVEYYDAQGLAGISINWQPVQDSIASDTRKEPPLQPAPQANPTQIPSGSPIAHVTTGVLNVRTGPGIQFERIDQISLYQRYPLLGQNEDGSWFLIDLKDGRTGWVTARFIFRTGGDNIPVVATPQPSDPLIVFAGTEALTLAQLNVRPAPDRNNTPLGVIPFDSTITVRGRSNNSVWYLVDFEDLQGWVFAPFIDLQGFKVFDLPFVE